MSVANHLDLSPADYDRRIRGLIPLYDELIGQAAAALQLAPRRPKRLVDLGIGTGALTKACLAVSPGAQVHGIDIDASMMAMLPARLGRKVSQVTISHGDFAAAAIPRCDAIVASYSLHHIRTEREKLAFFQRCYAALPEGGILVSGDCVPAAIPSAFAADLEVWYRHLAATFGMAKGKRVYASWANEDTYMPLNVETKLLERAGFSVEIPWRRSPFAVIAAIKN
jgi:SAM-dependent methyltransferase